MRTMRRISDGVVIKVTEGQRAQLSSSGYAVDFVPKKSEVQPIESSSVRDDSAASDATAKTVRRGRPRKNSNS